MRRKWVGLSSGVALAAVVFVSPARAAGFDHAHSLYARVLTRFVRDGLVDYAALQNDPKLDAYLNALAAVPENEFRAWPKTQQLAFLVNLYNAQTLRLVADHYPVKSIKGIGGLLDGPWDQPLVRLFGRKITLNALEHDFIRAQYREPRVHFALVCAALGCPPLRGEPYVAGRLDQQLDQQARIFLSTPEKNRLDETAHTLYLSPIFKWFEKDFTPGGSSVLSFVRRYLPEPASRRLERDHYEIRYTEYDWALNDFPRPHHAPRRAGDIPPRSLAHP